MCDGVLYTLYIVYSFIVDTQADLKTKPVIQTKMAAANRKRPRMTWHIILGAKSRVERKGWNIIKSKLFIDFYFTEFELILYFVFQIVRKWGAGLRWRRRCAMWCQTSSPRLAPGGSATQSTPTRQRLCRTSSGGRWMSRSAPGYPRCSARTSPPGNSSPPMRRIRMFHHIRVLHLTPTGPSEGVWDWALLKAVSKKSPLRNAMMGPENIVLMHLRRTVLMFPGRAV